jgi:hypothetical protein
MKKVKSGVTNLSFCKKHRFTEKFQLKDLQFRKRWLERGRERVESSFARWNGAASYEKEMSFKKYKTHQFQSGLL